MSAHFAFSPSGLWISKKICWGLLCVISGMICMTLIVFRTTAASVRQKLEMMIVSRPLVVWDCLENGCARVNSVGGFGYCKLIFLTTDGVLC